MGVRRLAVCAYGPTLLCSIGFGAVVPLIVLSARNLGASVGTAAVVSALLGIGQLLGDLPAGWVATRVGEKWAITGACLLDAACLAGMYLAHGVWFLSLMVLIDGVAGAVFGLARQTWLTEAIPLRYRARALSTLGGTFRVGYVVGPLVASWVIGRWDLDAAFVFASGMSAIAALVTLALPDLPPADLPESHGEPVAEPGTFAVLAAHHRVLGTLGVGAFAIMLVRAARQAFIPLWCEQHGLTASQTSLVFAISMAFDVLLFFPGGAIVDRWGRWAVAVPAMLVMGTGFALMPLAHGFATIALVGALLGAGNGISSGIVMTLGSDASPAVGRARFLAGWRLFADAGNGAGGLVISMITLVSPLWGASLALWALAWLGAGWLDRFIPRPSAVPGSR